MLTRFYTVTGVTHTSSYSYDTMGRLSAFSDGTKTESYTYDAQGNLINTSNGETASGTYDAQDRIQTWSTSGTLSRSGDSCYKKHDQCYDACKGNAICMKKCDKDLVKDLTNLPEDPKKWPQPPTLGTEDSSNVYRNAAIIIFSIKGSR